MRLTAADISQSLANWLQAMTSRVGTAQVALDVSEADMEVVAELCEFLHDTFEREIEDGTTHAELVLTIGTVLSYMFGEDQGEMH